MTCSDQEEIDTTANTVLLVFYKENNKLRLHETIRKKYIKMRNIVNLIIKVKSTSRRILTKTNKINTLRETTKKLTKQRTVEVDKKGFMRA